jgi:hypothetical protein
MGGFPEPKTTIALNGIPLPPLRERQKNSKLAPLRHALDIERWFAIPGIFNGGAEPLLEPSRKPDHFLARWHQLRHCEFKIASEHNRLLPVKYKQIAHHAERCASGAPGSRSGAEAGGRRLQAVVRPCCAPASRLSGPRQPRGTPSGETPRHTRGAPTPGHAYRITSSAWKRSVGGIVSPSASAVLRLMISSNFVGCSTGRSAGLAPLRILST